MYTVIGSFINFEGKEWTIEQNLTKKSSYIIQDRGKDKLGHAGSEANAWASVKYSAGINNHTHRSKGADKTPPI